MFEHDPSIESAPLGGMDSEYTQILEEEGYTPQEIGMFETEAEMTPAAEYEDPSAMSTASPAIDAQTEQEIVSTEEETNQETEATYEQENEQFDQTLVDD